MAGLLTWCALSPQGVNAAFEDASGAVTPAAMQALVTVLVMFVRAIATGDPSQCKLMALKEPPPGAWACLSQAAHGRLRPCRQCLL